MPSFFTHYGSVFPAEGQRRYRVALLGGCIANIFFARLHEATVRVLVKNGCEVHVQMCIRDSASILSTIQERGYVKKEGGKFAPTDLGTIVTDLLVESFNDIFDVTYTARMEDELDSIEDGKIGWTDALSEFYGRFKKDLEEAERSMRDIKRTEIATDKSCDRCGKPMVIKWGKHGFFLACTGYPDCTNTREISLDADQIGDGENPVEVTEQDAEEYCENCGRPMVLKKGRFGTFYACSGYPDCKTTKQIGGAQKKPDVLLEEKCPDCGHALALKTGRFGEFTACSKDVYKRQV